jgi:CxxC-x17-CxxC domain-containing protein
MGRFDNDRGNDRPRSGGGGSNRGFRGNSQPREMNKAICDECKKECEVPFKPTEGKPVYCKDCYSKKKPRY